MASHWFIQRGEKVYGPFESPEIRRLLQSGRLENSCRFRQGGDGEWLTATQLATPIGSASATGPAVVPPPITGSQDGAGKHSRIHPLTWAALAVSVAAVVVAAVIGFVASRPNVNAAGVRIVAQSPVDPPARHGGTSPAALPAAISSNEKADATLKHETVLASVQQSPPVGTVPAPESAKSKGVQLSLDGPQQLQQETALLPVVGQRNELPLPEQHGTAALVASIDESIVRVEVTKHGGTSTGSGFVLDESANIVTCYHVIEGAISATIQFHDKTRSAVVGVVAFSPGKDLAILRVRAPLRRVLPLSLAASLPEKGEKVLAFGSPRGLTGSVSDGIVSGCRSGREVRDALPDNGLSYDLDANWVQTTAPISPGNSGGPLILGTTGEVIGVNTWSQPNGQNLNFAISAEHVSQLLTNSNGKVSSLASLPPAKLSAEEKQEALQRLASQISDVDGATTALDSDIADLARQQVRDTSQLQVWKAAGIQRSSRATDLDDQRAAISIELEIHAGTMQPAIEAEMRTRRQVLLAEKESLAKEYADLEAAYYQLQATVASRATAIVTKSSQEQWLQQRRQLLAGQYQRLAGK